MISVGIIGLLIIFSSHTNGYYIEMISYNMNNNTNKKRCIHLAKEMPAYSTLAVNSNEPFFKKYELF